MSTYSKAGPISLKANICAYPPTRALLDGAVSSDLISFDFAGLKNAHAGFKEMLRHNRFDVSEMAVATFLQACELGKPFSMLPMPVLGRFHHDSIGYNDGLHPSMSPGDLAGKRVVVRSYTQTTGLWVRGVLQNDFGVDPDSVTWVCFDAPHLEEFTDPPSVIFAASDKDPARMLVDGEVDAGILGRNLPDDPRIKPLIENPDDAARDWFDRNSFVPPNHFVIVPNALCDDRPDVVTELWRMLVESRHLASGNGPDAWPVGIEANRQALECAIRYAHQQHMITRPIEVSALFHPLVRSLAP